ncbi:MAG: GNAT family N-acetyltransferase [Actinomycetota bacterium]
MELPPLPDGYTARGATMDDAAAVTELVAASNLADVGSAEVDLEETQGVWSRPSVRLDLDEHLVFDGHGKLAAWAELYYAQDAQGTVHPAQRGRSLGAHLLHWTEHRASQRSAEQHLAPYVRQSALDTDLAARGLFRSAGYEQIWASWILEIALDHGIRTVPPPEGVTIRGAEQADERAVHGVVETAFGEWESREPEPFEDWHAYMEARRSVNPSPWFVAVADGRIVAAATTVVYPDEGESWIEEFAVERAYRRKGVGTSLLTHAFAELRRAAAPKALLSTDSRGGGRHLYESVGMQVVRSYTKFGKSLSATD